MRELLTEWNIFLATAGTSFGLMAALTGLSFLLIGWRIGAIAIDVIYAIIGIALGVAFHGETVGAYVGGALGAMLCAGVSRLLRRFAAPVMAGVLGTLTTWTVLGGSTVPVPTIYAVLLLAFLMVGGIGLTNKKTTTVVLTSFVGASLVASGLTALAADSRILSPHFRELTSFGIFYPFLLIVPTISGIFLQLGALARRDGGEVKL